ncbi:MAG: hypothetical protein HY236_01205, partial [Acidobacteria bacterium]|nr:hypothetical protein [Acidobacteriota bacterium]
MKRHAWILIAAWSGLSLSAQTRVELAGPWERWIGSRFHDVITVPSSYRPIGTARLRREIELAPLKPDQRMLLRFEGVAHRAEARVNGKSAGSMGPWTPYDFDVTDQVRAGRNQIEVEVTDWQVPLGPSGAWEASGGIIRDVHLETRSDPYIENAHLQYKLSAGLDTARCDLDVYVRSSAAAQGRLTAALMRGGTPVAQAARDIATEAGGSKISIGFEVASPLLWSPENPNLYTLRVRLRSANGEDLFTAETGFRDLAIHGNQFLLSGKPLVLRGVCRHDIWKDQGHTMTQAQIEQDLGMTKAMGANFIRLVHYPHNKRVVDTANRLGLFVTEESGLVWLDFRRQSRETIETGLGNLERTLRRDWNSPALFALLLSNESSPTLEVIQEARRRIRALAPDLFMSAAR